MSQIGERERLSDEESADLNSRVERFRAVWQPDGTTAIEWFLPPRGSNHRFAVLVELVLIDMDRRAQHRLPFEVESYLTAYSQDVSANTVPVAVLTAEYRLRHRFGDKPKADEYQRRFPTQYEEFARQITQLVPKGTLGLSEHTPVTDVNPVAPSKMPRKSTVVHDRQGEDAPAIPPPPPPAKSGALERTGPVSFLETPRPGEGSTILPTDTPYQLLRKIGSGAFGEVFEALAPGGVRVAVKRISRSVDHPASKSERSALDSIKELSHPFLLKTNAYWVFDDRLVIVMELADGSLSDRIEHHKSQGRTGVPPEELIPLFEQAGDALDYLHSQNVSHRDIKPENILIMRGYAKVADFGLARIHEHTMTLVNNTVGTPAYMAPEMWKQKVSLQSDQYSLAATYVRARLGRHLFTTNVLVDLANFHINETPNLDPLPPKEQKVLLKALAKDPNDRYQSCVEFGKALRAAVMPTLEPKSEPKKEGGRAVVWPTLAVAVACVLVVGAVTYFVPRKPDGPPPEPGTDKKETVVVVQPEKRIAVYPDNWVPFEPAGTRLIGDKHYHYALKRTIGDVELTAYLIYPTAASHPDPFYMLEYKVTNKVFNTVWKRISDGSEVRSVRNKNKEYIREAWRKGGQDRILDLDGADADLPVLAVTVLEALLVAEELNGTLPTLQQWLKATGILEANENHGPAGSPINPPATLLTDFFDSSKLKLLELQRRSLALGQPGPLSVHDARAAGDVGRAKWRIRQLVSNGPEWLCHSKARPNDPYTISSLPAGDQQAITVGSSPTDVNIKSERELRDEVDEYSWTTTTGDGVSGFRIVLKPR